MDESRCKAGATCCSAAMFPALGLAARPIWPPPAPAPTPAPPPPPPLPPSQPTVPLGRALSPDPLWLITSARLAPSSSREQILADRFCVVASEWFPFSSTLFLAASDDLRRCSARPDASCPTAPASRWPNSTETSACSGRPTRWRTSSRPLVAGSMISIEVIRFESEAVESTKSSPARDNLDSLFGEVSIRTTSAPPPPPPLVRPSSRPAIERLDFLANVLGALCSIGLPGA